MIIKMASLSVLLLLLMASCSNDDVSNKPGEISEPSPIKEPIDTNVNDITDSIEGMLLVEGSSDTVILGTNIKGAKISESPEMGVVLDYDFLMDEHETICKDFIALMSDSILAKSINCSKDNHPVSNVTFYDAVLYANKKSKSQDFDTVYEYTSATFDSENHCTNLGGFVFHPEKKGFRLPTEAEWIKVASKDYDPNKSFNNSNSDFKTNTVCSQGKDSLGFCDFSGNVMEWVNDHFGLLKDTIVSNYAGLMNKNDLDERIVKGGYFGLEPNSINLYSRGDVYTVTSASKTEYVGFRLVLGKIPDVLWFDNSGKVAMTPITMLATSSDIMKYTKTLDTKLAFVNMESGNLAYVDYSEEGMGVIEIADTLSVYHPDISPDGKRVAFSTGFEGVSKTSAVYVRDLNQTGSHLVKLNVKSAAIPRWQVLENGDTVITYVTNAGNNKDSSTFFSYSTWSVPFSNGAFGQPSELFKGAYHGGVTQNQKFAVTGSTLFRKYNNEKTSIGYNKEQVCNVSLNQDGSNRTLFLDFGSETGQDFVGKKYAVHGQILIADSTGKLIQSIESPSGYTFDHSEWATGQVESNIVATLTNVNGAHEKITLINTNDSTSMDLVKGSELWHPCLWIKKKEIVIDDPIVEKSKLDPDSAGMYYNSSGVCGTAMLFRYKMEFLWQYKDTANVVIIGSSRSYFGVNPFAFSEPVFAVNLGISATSIYGNSFLFNNYILPHVKNLKVLILSIDIDRGGNSGYSSNNMFHKSYASYSGYVYDMNHNFWKDEEPVGLFEATYNSPGSSSMANIIRPTRGYNTHVANGWGNPNVTEDSTWMDMRLSVFNNNVDMLVDLIDTCQKNNITVIGVLFPVNPKYKETGAYGYAGLRRSEAPAIIERLANLSDTHKNFILMDENKMGNHDYDDSMASDASHLATPGANQLTQRLDSIIHTLDLIK